MSAKRKERPADAPPAPKPNRRQRRAAPKRAALPNDAILSEPAPIYGPVIVVQNDVQDPEPVAVVDEATEVKNLPAIIPTAPLDVSIAVAAMAATSARINRRRPFMGWDLLGVAAAVLAAGVLKLAVLAII